ncbi:acid protease [Dokdonia sinensis]|uniref:Acid protease n=1 Tax=Dokdonia sinensis TaxID=2479847 RepID=A0A3M0FVU0_9FLAO|nr:retropepsin-like aspartic protease [Dokdonia sinensis]RMB56801.1 acid protease [Dokdonia sinensis]
MASLREFLIEKGYTRVRLFPTVTNHLEMKAKINGIEGSFILDTGASSSCIDFSHGTHFELISEASEVLAAGAGATDMRTELSQGNSLTIGKWTMKELDIVLFDLSNVNTALENHNAQPVHGILGADVLNGGRGIIDYKYNCLYLK